MMTSAVERVVAAAEGDDRVVAVLRYGSTARGDDGPASDVDLCLVLEPEDGSGTDGSRVRLDVVTEAQVDPEEVDVQVFQAVPMYVRKRVLEDAEVLWVGDLDALYDVAIRFVREWEDYRPIYEDYLEAVRVG